MGGGGLRWSGDVLSAGSLTAPFPSPGWRFSRARVSWLLRFSCARRSLLCRFSLLGSFSLFRRFGFLGEISLLRELHFRLRLFGCGSLDLVFLRSLRIWRCMQRGFLDVGLSGVPFTAMAREAVAPMPCWGAKAVALAVGAAGAGRPRAMATGPFQSGLRPTKTSMGSNTGRGPDRECAGGGGASVIGEKCGRAVVCALAGGWLHDGEIVFLHDLLVAPANVLPQVRRRTADIGKRVEAGLAHEARGAEP